jgi:hypothetical protein
LRAASICASASAIVCPIAAVCASPSAATFPRLSRFGVGGFRLLAQGGDLVGQSLVIGGELSDFDLTESFGKFVETSGGGGLCGERGEVGVHLGSNIVDAEQVRVGRFQLALRFALLDAVLLDAGGFLEQFAPVFRSRGKDRVHLRLVDDRVRPAPDAGIEEKIGDVF